MSKATVTVQYVNKPKGKGPASIKDTNGTYYKFWTREFPLTTFEEGKTYNLDIADNEYNGRPDPTIKGVTPTNGSSNGPHSVVNFPQNNERSARIERQTALKVAGLLTAALIEKGKLDNTEVIRATTDIAEQFEVFIQAAGTVEAKSETSAPVEDRGVEL